MDKPNLHRLLELFVYTIPTYGHVRNISEMGFEEFHQKLKPMLKRGTHHNKHLMSVESLLVNDWISRFTYCLSEIKCNNIINYDSPIFITMKRLMIGEKNMSITGKSESEKSFLDEFVKRIHNLLEKRVFKNLSETGFGGPLKKFNRQNKFWECHASVSMDSISDHVELQSGKKIILSSHDGNGRKEEDLKVYSSARFCVGDKKFKHARSYQYNTIRRDTVVYFFCEQVFPKNVLVPSTRGIGTQISIAVCFLIAMDDSNPWAIGYILEEDNGFFSSSKTVLSYFSSRGTR